ncbi:MAG: DUF1853 family protein [Flavobacteriaceae bacterium]|nr:DUF1853 family protein [Flavobacteriaceae bacterium]
MTPKNLRLGKRVERFVGHELKQHPAINILKENIQIQNDKITVGEIDCLLKDDETAVHLEIIYKFYLYDISVGSTELEHWIGPNRKDSLISKLTKLKEKQLPLLYNPHTKPTLDALNLKINALQQFVCFKAQLFIPYEKEVDFIELNRDCINGFHIHFKELAQFSSCKFYIPSKVNWLQEIQIQVPWLTYHQFFETVKTMVNQNRNLVFASPETAKGSFDLSQGKVN